MLDTNLASELAQNMQFSAEDESSGPEIPALTVQDRCDRCSAQALYRIRFPSGNLLDFCGHHHNEYMVGILRDGGVVVQSIVLNEGAPGVGI